MNSEFEKQSRSIADSSGFPLQVSIAHAVRSSNNWHVFLEEHPWRSQERNTDGFIDLIIEGNRDKKLHCHCMIIECKSVRQTAWVFLVPRLNPQKLFRALLWTSDHNATDWRFFDWKSDEADPDSYESQFCAIPGQEHGRKTLLERLAAELVESVEAFAFQEKQVEEKQKAQWSFFYRNYIPVIVTTAELRVAFFDPAAISLADGSLPADASFETVPFVRFRKSLTSRLPETSSSLQDAHRLTQRTVFVVNAESFPMFLQQWKILS